MASSTHSTSIKISAEDRATAVFKHVEQHLAGLEKESKTLNDGLSRLSGGFFTLKNAIIGVGVGASIKSLVDANQQILGLSTSFKAALGSAQAADKELEFLRALTNKLGLEFYSTAEQVRGFLVASNAMGMSTETSRKVITGLGEAAAAMGLTTEKTSRAMLALEQMMSKGVVSSEELKRQLGDLVPGAFQTAARAMGMTTAELDKAMKAGTVLASDLLPRLAEEWHKMFGAAAIEMSTSAVSEINRLKTAFTDLKIELAEGQFIDTFKSSVVGLTEYIQDHEQELVGTFQGMVEAGSQLGATIVPALEDTAGVLVKIANAVSKLPEPVVEALFGAAIGYKVGGKAGAVVGAIGVPLMSNLDSLETYQKQLKNAQDALEYQLKLYDDADPIIARTRKEIANLEAQIAKLTKTQQDANEATYDYYAELERLATEDPFDSLFSGTSENIKKVGDESEKASKKLKTFADSIIEKTRTPIEAYTVQVGKLEQAHKAGYLTLEVFNRALSMEKENLDKANRALQDAVDWTDYYAGELEKLYAGATDESEFFKDEVVNNNEEIKDSTEETWRQCGDIVSDFFRRVIGEGEDLVDVFEDFGKRIAGAIAGDLATMGFNAILGLPGGTTGTSQMLNLLGSMGSTAGGFNPLSMIGMGMSNMAGSIAMGLPTALPSA
ncbi:MAG TPA: tape measure protein, partial [Thermodesulfobacteriota bacterium]|nr:tape measure protein [Thermodesulfobacteriota bacterium]